MAQEVYAVDEKADFLSQKILCLLFIYIFTDITLSQGEINLNAKLIIQRIFIS